MTVVDGGTRGIQSSFKVGLVRHTHTYFKRWYFLKEGSNWHWICEAHHDETIARFVMKIIKSPLTPP